MEIGDKVKVKNISNSPIIRIKGFSKDFENVICHWFTENNFYQEYSFLRSEIILVEEKKGMRNNELYTS